MADNYAISGAGGDPRFQGSLSEIIASFQRAGVTQGPENSAAPTNETNANSGNADGGEMGRGRGRAAEQGSPGPLVTAAVGQEPKINDPPQKEPASNVAPAAKGQAEPAAREVKANEAPAANLSSKVAEASVNSGAANTNANTTGTAADTKAPDAGSTKNAVDPTIAAGAEIWKSGATSNGVSTQKDLGNLSNLVADARDKGPSGATNTPGNER